MLPNIPINESGIDIFNDIPFRSFQAIIAFDDQMIISVNGVIFTLIVKKLKYELIIRFAPKQHIPCTI
jgi:hypothetical protein